MPVQEPICKERIAADVMNRAFEPKGGDILYDILVKNDTKSRKLAPIFEGFLRYFPNSMKAVACLSRMASAKHNGPGKFGWSWNRSDDHGDCIARHQLEPETPDEFNLPHAVAVAWRAMAQLEKLLVEKYGLKLPPAAYMVPEEGDLSQDTLDKAIRDIKKLKEETVYTDDRAGVSYYKNEMPKEYPNNYGGLSNAERAHWDG